MALRWYANRPIHFELVRAFNTGDQVPDSVVVAQNLQALGYVTQIDVPAQDPAAVLRALTTADRDTDAEREAFIPARLSDPALRAAFGLVVASTVTANGALAVGKHNPVDTSGGARTMTLPTGAVEGATVGVEKVDASTNAVTVSGNLRGVAGQSVSLPWAHETLVLRADASGSWWPVAGHKTKASLDGAYGLTLTDKGAFNPATTYAKGDVVQYNGARYSANQPGSGTTTSTVRTNAVPNPRMQNSRVGWSAGTNVTVTVDTVKATATLTTSAAIAVGNSLYLLAADIPAVAGETWSTSVRVSVPTNGVAVTLRATLGFYPVTSTNVNGPMVTIQPGASAVLTVAGGVCPAGKTGVRLLLQAGTGGVASGAVIIVEQPIVEKAAAPGSYFSGATAATTDTTCAWTGTADNSPSTATTVTTVSTLGVPGASGASWNLLAPATKPTRTALGNAYSPAVTAASRRIAWLAEDRITLMSSNAAAFAFSRDDAATWTVAHTFTNPVISARSLPSGEVLVATRADVTTASPFELWLSTGWPTDPTTATWAKVLTGTTPMASPANGWSWSIYGQLVLVAEYGPKEGTAYNGQPVATGGNARYIYMSLDGGKTFSTLFDLNSWLSTTGNQDTTGCHLHGVHYDPYWDRIWVTHGDNRNAILFSDDLGATWQQAQDGTGAGGLYQSVGIISLPQCVLFASDGPPNGIARISRSQGKHAGAYAMEDAYSINTSGVLTHLCQSVFKATRPGDDGPVIFGFAPDVVAGKSLIVTTVDGYTFNGAWTDTGADATAGLDGAFGPTVRGNLVAHNGTTSQFIVGPMPAY